MPQKPKGPTCQVAPLGLRAIFNALQPDGYRARYTASHADDYVDVPNAVLETLHGDASEFLPVLFRTADREYPGNMGPDGQRAHDTPELLAVSAFWCGVAVCWHVMAAINGERP